MCSLEIGLWVVSASFGSATGKATGKAIGVDVGGRLESDGVMAEVLSPGCRGKVEVVSPGCRGKASRGSQPFASERARTRRSVRYVS